MAKKKAVAVCEQSTAPVVDTVLDTVSAWSIADIDRMKEALRKREQVLSQERIQRDEELTAEANEKVTEATKKLVSEIKARTKKLNTQAQKYVGKVFELKLTLPITLTLSIDEVYEFNDMLAAQDELNGLDDMVAYNVHVVVDDPDELSKHQLDTISDVLAQVRTTITDAASGACSEVFELFPKLSESEKAITKEYDSILKLVSKLDSAVCAEDNCDLSTYDLIGD